MLTDILIVVAAFLGSILAGLFGGGAGLIFTPTIYLFLSRANPGADHLMQTSITTMIASLMVSGLIAACKHHRYGHIDWAVLKWSSPLIIIGSVVGCFIVAYLPSHAMIYFFSLATLTLAFRSSRQLIAPATDRVVQPNNGWSFKYVGSFALGVISSLSGAASFALPYYEKIGLSIKKAIGTTTVVVWLYSIFVLIFMVFLGLHEDKLPTGNIGFLNYQYLWLLTIPTIPGALLGAKLSQVLPERKLKIAFTILLYVIGLTMLIS